MDARPIETTKAKTIYDFAREFLSDAGGLTAPAVERLQAFLRDDEALRLSLATQAVMAMAASAVGTTMRNDRAAIWSNAGRPAGATRAKVGVAALANGLRDSLMNFPLAGGVRLKDATREQVERQAQLYATASADMGHKARWLAAVAARVNPGQRVGDALTEADVTALREEAADA